MPIGSSKWLVLCDVADVSALWVYQGLVARGLAPVEVVTAQVLSTAVRWEHRLDPAGATIDITLADGRRLRGDTTRGALNRITVLPTAHLDGVAPSDRDYAIQEMSALFLSWLHTLPEPVLNRPAPYGLSGRWRHPAEWTLLAARAGLTPHPYRHTSDESPEEAAILPRSEPVTTVFVVGKHVVASSRVPATVRSGCHRLAELTGVQLLGIDFAVDNQNRWRFVGASVTPDLTLGGEPLLSALFDVLTT
jgi:hypothetical protein